MIFARRTPPTPTNIAPTIDATIEIAPSKIGKVVAPGNVVPKRRFPSSIAATVVTQ